MKTILRTLGLMMLFAGSMLSGCGGGDNSTPAPVILGQPISQTVSAGTGVTLTVVTAVNDGTYQWYKNNVAIPGATGASFTISPTSLADSGTYYVVVTNSFGSATSQTVTITVTRTSTGGSVVTVD